MHIAIHLFRKGADSYNLMTNANYFPFQLHYLPSSLFFDERCLFLFLYGSYIQPAAQFTFLLQ